MTSVLFCQEAKELLDTFGETVEELIRLHEEQFQSVVGGDLDSTRFDDLIHMANERKHEAKYAYLHHLETHGCSTYDGPNQE
jgi:tRNA splicing endonuclease